MIKINLRDLSKYKYQDKIPLIINLYNNGCIDDFQPKRISILSDNIFMYKDIADISHDDRPFKYWHSVFVQVKARRRVGCLEDHDKIIAREKVFAHDH